MEWRPDKTTDKNGLVLCDIGSYRLKVFNPGARGPRGVSFAWPQWAVLAPFGKPGRWQVLGSGHGYHGVDEAKWRAANALYRELGKIDESIREDLSAWLYDNPYTVPCRTLIISCARSGTKYIAEVLRLCGLDVGHEKIGADVTVGWMYACEKTPFAEFDGFDAYGTILHLYRDALDTIGSCLTLTNASWQVIERELEMNEPSALKRAMRYYLEWDQKCNALADWTHDVAGLYPMSMYEELLASETGVDLELLRSALTEVETDIGHRDHPKLTWEQLHAVDSDLAEEIQAWVSPGVTGKERT